MNKKLTKLLSVFLIAGAVGTGVAGISACTNKTPEHTHTADNVWHTDTNGHWHECTADDGAKLDEGTHVDANNDGKCDTCQYQMTTPAAPAITGVEASASTTQATVGDEITLTATVSGTGSYDTTVTWAITEGADKATLNGNKLTVNEAGTVKVQATANGDSTKKSAEIVITVEAALDNAITVPYEGPAAGPAAGSQDLTLGFKGSDFNDTGVLSAAWTDGTFTITSGEVRNRVDTSSKYTRSVKNAVVSVDAPAGAKLEIVYSSGSSTIGNASYKLTKPDGTSETVTINAGDKVLQTLTIDSTEAGTYKFEKAGGTVDVWECKLSYTSTATAIKAIDITSEGLTDYLVTQKVDCTGVTIVAIDSNNVPHAIDLKNCKFDTSNYNPDASGEYEIGVTYYLDSNLDSDKTEFTASYSVKVYQVDSIVLNTIGLSGSKQVTVQQAFLTDGTFNSDNLSVTATCKLGDNTIVQKLKSEWYSISTPTLTSEGIQTVNVTVNPDYTVGGKNVAASYDIIVKNKLDAVDGKIEVTVGEAGDFATLTQAVQYLKACALDSSVNKVIKLAEGTYEEKVWIDIDNVTLIGQGTEIDDTVITYSLVEGDADPLSNALWALNCATVHVTGANFKTYNLAIRNDFDYIANSSKYSGSQAAQGVALTIDSDGAVLYKTHLYGNQDTLYLKSGRSYFYQSQIDGNVDFIFGNETGLAYFEDCTIMAISRSAVDKGTDQNGYITAAKHTTAKKPDYGYIFDGCTITDDGKVADGAMALGRPWGEAATVAYINCDFSAAYATSAYGSGAKTDRWCAMSAALPTNADFCEYGSTGAGAISEAVTGGSILTEEQAANYTKANIFAATNGNLTSTKFDWELEFTKLKVLAGLESDMPEETTKTVNLKDETLPDGSCVDVINERYSDILTWSGTGSFQLSKPENGVKVGTDTVIAINIVGEVTVAPGYFLTGDDYIITYTGGKATIKITAISGTYGDFIGSIVVDTSITPEDTQVVTVTIDYNDGETANGSVEAVVGLPLGKPVDPVRAGYKFIGWQVNGTDYDFSTNVTEAFTLVAQWEAQDNLDLTDGGTVNLYEFTTGTLQGTSGEYRGIIVDATTGKFAPRSNDVQVNAGVKIKFKVNASTTADQITVTFTAAAGDSYIPTCDVTVEEISGETYAVLTLGGGYPSTMTVVIANVA
ncbi:MAG: pectinesterase family protein [Candidatus Coproplasma sp.]